MKGFINTTEKFINKTNNYYTQMIRMNKTKNLKRDERMKCKHLIVRFERVMPDRGEVCRKSWSLSPERCNENCPDYEPIEGNK